MTGIILPWGLSAPGADDALLLTAGHPSPTHATALLDGHPPGPFIDLDLADPAGVVEHTHDTLVMLARTRTDLRRSVAACAALPKVRRLVVVIADGPKETPAPLPAAAALPGMPVELGVERVGPVERSWCVWVRFAQACPASEVFAALAAAAGGRSPATVPVVALGGPGMGRWRPADGAAIPTTETGEMPQRRDLPAADLMLTNHAAAGAAAIHRPGRPVRWDAYAEASARSGALIPTDSGPSHVPPIDEGSVNPIGFHIRPTGGVGALLGSGQRAGARIELDGQILVRIGVPGAVTDADIGKLRDLRGVRLHWGGHPGPVPLAQVVAGLAAAGVPVCGEDVPPWLGSLLGPRLTGLIERFDPADLDVPLRREEHSVRLRRAALREHGTTGRWAGLAKSAGWPSPSRASISVLLCTRRPELVGFALAQVARQRDVDLELILVLHGASADAPGVRSAVAAFPKPITVLEVPASVPFGSALNRAAAVARGTHLAKMDDDDWYGPEHLADLLLAQTYSGAGLVGSAAEFIYLSEIKTTVRRVALTERFADHVAGSAMLFDRGLFMEMGGARPIPRSVDGHLLLAVQRAGGTIYRTHGLGFMVRRERTGHTWQEPVSYFLRAVVAQWRGFAPSALLEGAVDGADDTALAGRP